MTDQTHNFTVKDEWDTLGLPNDGKEVPRKYSTNEIDYPEQKWIDVPKYPVSGKGSKRGNILNLKLDHCDIEVRSIPVNVHKLKIQKGWKNDGVLIKGAPEKYAINRSKTIFLGSPNLYRNIENADNPLQKDKEEANYRIAGGCLSAQINGKWVVIAKNPVVRYNSYIYSMSYISLREKLSGYDTYTIFRGNRADVKDNANVERLALALGTDVANHLERHYPNTIQRVVVYYGQVIYLDGKEKTNWIHRAEALASVKTFPAHIASFFVKSPKYKEQYEFRYVVVIENRNGEAYKYEDSLEVEMSKNFQAFCGYTIYSPK